jgi:hypothetical protein
MQGIQMMRNIMSGNRHSHLAMKAARRIGNAKQKEKVGRTICYHLLMMIEQEESLGQRDAPVQTAAAAAHRLPQRSVSQRKQFSLSI